MRFFIPFVELQHAEAVLSRIAKGAGATVPARKIRVLYFQKDGKNRSATVGRPLRDDGRIVTAILPLDRGGFGIFTCDPDGTVRKSGPVVIAAEDANYGHGSVKFFDPPTAIESSAGAGDDLRKRLAARRKLFGKVQRLADSESIAWGDALRKMLLDPKNLALVAAAQEPRKPRKSRQRLSDEELEKRIRALDGGSDDIRKTTGTEPEVEPVRKTDGTIDEVATAIKKVHRAGGTRVHRRS